MITNLQSEFREYLVGTEYLVWMSKPKQGLILRSSDFFMIPFSAFWFAFSIFWTYTVSKTNVLFALFGVPFVAIGLFLLFGRFVYDSIKRKKTFYGFTEDRVIIKSGVYSTYVHTIALKDVQSISLKENKDGSGSIVLSKTMENFTFKNRTKKLQSPNFVLEEIYNVKNVYNQLSVLKKNA